MGDTFNFNNTGDVHFHIYNGRPGTPNARVLGHGALHAGQVVLTLLTSPQGQKLIREGADFARRLVDQIAAGQAKQPGQDIRVINPNPEPVPLPAKPADIVEDAIEIEPGIYIVPDKAPDQKPEYPEADTKTYALTVREPERQQENHAQQNRAGQFAGKHKAGIFGACTAFLGSIIPNKLIRRVAQVAGVALVAADVIYSAVNRDNPEAPGLADEILKRGRELINGAAHRDPMAQTHSR